LFINFPATPWAEKWRQIFRYDWEDGLTQSNRREGGRKVYGAEIKVYVELEPTPSTCIETLARRAYEQTLSRILEEQGEGEDLLERLELLRLFLESTDFGHLRSQYERYLTEGRRVKFIIHSSEGKVSYEFMVQ
jgi:hypothetical protein